MDVGAGNKDILRIIPLKDTLIVLKEDGIFGVTGDYPFRLDSLDAKTILTTPRAVIGGESCLYGLFNSGVCRVDGTGVRIISSPIADDFRQLNTGSAPVVCALNETDGILLVKTYSGTSTTQPVWHCYNIRTNAWTNFDFNTGNYKLDDQTVASKFIDTALFYRPTFDANAKLALSHTRITSVGPTTWTSSLFKETRLNDPDNYNLQYIEGDFAEATATLNGAISGGTVGVSKTLVLNGAFSGSVTVNVGDIIYAGSLLNMNAEPTSDDYFGLVTVVNSSTSYTVKQISKKATGSISNGATLRVLRAYTTRAAYCVNNPTTSRHYRDITYMFEHFNVNAPRSIITTDQNGTEANSSIIFTDSTASDTTDTRFKRILFPSGHQFANAITVGIENWEAGTWWHLIGIGLCYEDVSERNSR
jgi:hypothetical protein